MLAILLTAPVGAIAISLLGPILLKKDQDSCEANGSKWFNGGLLVLYFWFISVIDGVKMTDNPQSLDQDPSNASIYKKETTV